MGDLIRAEDRFPGQQPDGPVGIGVQEQAESAPITRTNRLGRTVMIASGVAAAGLGVLAYRFGLDGMHAATEALAQTDQTEADVAAGFAGSLALTSLVASFYWLKGVTFTSPTGEQQTGP